MGYLEALSQTKTIFRGINPHDPLDGIVLNGGINPDFVMMLEKNFFKANSENPDKDELYFARYQAERDKIIEWLKQEFQALSIDDEYLTGEAKISQEELFQRLQGNEWVWSIGVSDNRLKILDIKKYLKGLESQELLETLPKGFCIDIETKDFKIDPNSILEKSKSWKEQRKKLRKSEDTKIYYLSSGFR